MAEIKRLRDQGLSTSSCIDYGAGNGEIAKRIFQQGLADRIICYEPDEIYASEAIANLPGGIEVIRETDALKKEVFDIALCLEVLEHLDSQGIYDVLYDISSLLKDGGYILVGLPMEQGLPALYKGLFRRRRNKSQYDGQLGNIAKAFFGSSNVELERPFTATEKGRFTHYHTGFSCRRVKNMLEERFTVVKVLFSTT